MTRRLSHDRPPRNPYLPRASSFVCWRCVFFGVGDGEAGKVKRSRISPISAKRRAYLEELDSMRPAVKERSGGICEFAATIDRCTAQATEVHHIKRRSQGGGNELENLIDLCGFHHRWIHTYPEEGFAAGFLKHAWET